ncbi:TonB-dependent receptor [uncultured Aquimarina sp.]|uniref:SusC/RagA family TonB-linked outer membrane protein n=1 Tax=uncultured Aquimarina sp. TaxID=575652 RepID=UPI002637B529|nr:TonB-dependent receptor [uncultured Aquimarina sp.]
MNAKQTYLKILKKSIPIFILMFGTGLFAQIEITGTVTSDDGVPIPGANISVQNKAIGTTTDFDGLYKIEVPDESSVLLFSYVGYKDQKITVGSQRKIDVVLSASVESLDQIVVVGYGSRRKKDLTGAVVSVEAEDITAYPSATAQQTLQGRAAGVAVQSANGGEPGADIRIRVRGATSINASSDAIFVVDGFVGAALPAPEDIASIQVLKDASATAIYGSRGANGVVIVTTKKGKKGRMRIDFNTSYSTQTVTNTLDLLNAEQFGDYIQEINPGYVRGSADTDWQDVIFKTGQIANHQIALSGGAENVDYYLSGTFFDQNGAVLGSGLERFSFTNNININFSDRLKVGMNALGRRSTREGARTQESTGGTGSAGAISAAFRFSPDQGIRDANGDFTLPSVGDDIDNPFATTTQIFNESVNDLFQTNVYADLKLFEGLSFKSTLGYNVRNNREGTFFPTTTVRGAGVGGEGSIQTIKQTNILSENYFTYKNDLSFAKFSATVGYSYQKERSERVTTSGAGFLDDGFSFWNLDGAANLLFIESRLLESELASYYGRINFDILDKYLITFNARQDGSSTFSANNKWGFFPSGAIAWNMGDESFLQNSKLISQWKWRVSYGLTGNRAIQPFGTLATYEDIISIQGGELVNAVALQRLANDNLKWETTKQFNVGVNIGLFNNRISLTADYYDMITEDLLLDRPLPETSGLSNPVQLQNVGSLENKGFEIELSTRNLVGAFTWNTNINFSRNRNKVLELPDGEDIRDIGNSSPGHLLLPDVPILREGQPVGVYFGYVYDGVYQNGDTFLPGAIFEQQAGGERYRDLNGDGELNSDDQTIIGNPHPDFTFGINNTFAYKGFDLNVFFQGAVGGDMFNFTLLELNTLTGSSNATTEALNRWSLTNPNTNIPSAAQRTRIISSRWVYDGSYARLKNITLGYSFDERLLEKLKMTKLRVYVSGQNLVTFTDYPGLDPEVLYRSDSNSRSNINLGLDYGSYPNVRSYTLGLNVSF